MIFRIIKGERPDIPESIAEFKGVENMIETTWKQEPNDRPTATRIKHILEKQLKVDKTTQLDTSLYDTYNPIRYFHSFIYIQKLFILFHRFFWNCMRGFFGLNDAGGGNRNQ